MPLVSLGDMARHFTGQRDMTALRLRLDTLSQEVASEQVRDPTRHLQGRADRLALADHRIARLGAEIAVADTLSHRMATAQTALGRIDSQRAALSERLLALPTAATPAVMAQMGELAEATLRDMFGALAVRHGSDHLFSGRAADRAPLADADSLLAGLRAAAAGVTDPAALADIATHFFTDPAGGFAQWGYRGGTGPQETREIGEGMQVTLGPRADDPALRQVFAALAGAVLLGESTLPMADSTRANALQHMGAALVEAGSGMAALTSRLGMNEGVVARIATQQGAARTAAMIQRNDMVGIDQAKAISTLQQLQTQLEIQYTITGRLAGLGLAGYLR